MQGVPKKKETVQAVSYSGGSDVFLATRRYLQKRGEMSRGLVVFANTSSKQEKTTPDKAGAVCKWISQLNVDKTKNKIEEIFENCKKIKDKVENAVLFNCF